MATVKVDDFSDWRQGFSDFARVLRDSTSQVCGIVEKRDATAEQLQINELNPAYFCFKADWLWQNLAKLKNDNSQREYYLTDLVAMAGEQNRSIAAIEIDAREALGVNTPEQLALLEKFE
jgi:bifunctional N-acetylglucosamine-1-phosphate-uridyltransferase/glucosamine-1-phosphate-acetyltransferase GlmU-like protein